MANARQVIRETIVDRLYRGHEIIRGTTDGAGSTSTLVDSALIQGMFEVNDYLGAYIWMSAGTGDESSGKVVAFDRATGTFTLSPVLGGASGSGSTYEIHYDLAPERVNDAIIWSIEFGTSNALSGPSADATTNTLELEVVVEGALSYCKKAIARQTQARDPSRPKTENQIEKLLKQAQQHEANWLEGLALLGYNPYVGFKRQA